jgi:hypothetical protein
VLCYNASQHLLNIALYFQQPVNTGLGGKGAVLVSLHMGINLAAKDTQVGDGWFSTIEQFIWSFSGYCSGGGSIEGMEEAGESFSPKASWEM